MSLSTKKLFFSILAITTWTVSTFLSSSAQASDAMDLPTEVSQAVQKARPNMPANWLDRIYRLEHEVPVGNQQTLHVTETFTLRSWLRFPHRAAVMVTSATAKGSLWNVDVDGYDGGAILAKRGFFAYAVDPLGVGESTMPADGRTITFQQQINTIKTVIQAVRLARGVPKVDLIGESYGGAVLTQICANPAITRSCTVSSIFYRQLSAVGASLFTPEFLAFLDSLPNGYFPQDASSFDGLLALSPPDVVDYVHATQPGLYATAAFYAVYDGLPYFDPSVAQVPGLVLRGEGDFLDDAADDEALAADYGGGASLVTIPGATHIPRLETSPSSANYWNAVLGFIDPQ